ncbi:MAG: hypothetical protein ABSC10_14415 [Candidatus Acidiferrales bacterium]|jgi:hypothetical protein
MFKWMGTRVRTYDATGRLLERLGSLLIGLAVGVGIARYWGPLAFKFNAVAAMVGTGLIYFADRRAKATDGTTAQLSLK